MNIYTLAVRVLYREFAGSVLHVCAVLVLAVTAISANALPSVSSPNLYLSVNCPGSSKNSEVFGSISCGSASASADSRPHVQATAGSNGNQGSGAGVSMQYYWGVFGPDGDPVPINITFDARAFRGTTTVAEGDVFFQFSNGNKFFIALDHIDAGGLASCLASTIYECHFGSVALTFTWLVPPNVQQSVLLGAFVLANDSHAGVGGAAADPFFAIDPAYSLAGSYAIVVSPGILNAPSSIPEPGTFALLLAGIGLLRIAASSFRRDSKSNAPVAS